MNLHCDLSPFAPVSWEMPGCPQTGCRARGGHKPVAEQDIMMRNNLRGREPIQIPGAMPILCGYYTVLLCDRYQQAGEERKFCANSRKRCRLYCGGKIPPSTSLMKR